MKNPPLPEIEPRGTDSHRPDDIAKTVLQHMPTPPDRKRRSPSHPVQSPRKRVTVPSPRIRAVVIRLMADDPPSPGTRNRRLSIALPAPDPILQSPIPGSILLIEIADALRPTSPIDRATRSPNSGKPKPKSRHSSPANHPRIHANLLAFQTRSDHCADHARPHHQPFPSPPRTRPTPNGTTHPATPTSVRETKNQLHPASEASPTPAPGHLDPSSARGHSPASPASPTGPTRRSSLTRGRIGFDGDDEAEAASRGAHGHVKMGTNATANDNNAVALAA